MGHWPPEEKIEPHQCPACVVGSIFAVRSPFQCWPVHPFGQKGDKGVRDRIVSARPRAFVRHGLITPIRLCWASCFTCDYCPQINTTGTASADHFRSCKNYTKELRGFLCFPQGLDKGVSRVRLTLRSTVSNWLSGAVTGPGATTEFIFGRRRGRGGCGAAVRVSS